MKRIIEQLKRQREEAKDRFIDNSLLNSMSKGLNGINTKQDLDVIRELNIAISCLENAIYTKQDGKEAPERGNTLQEWVDIKQNKEDE